MEKRYQVFISSTYEDLKDERRAVEEVIISSRDFPVQMESFPAADQDQFEFIKSLIDDCDYYVLIIAGKYGSTAEDGLSYTEKEYRYAVSKGVPILVLLHGDRDNLSQRLTERSPKQQEKLQAFIEVVSNGRLRKTWVTIDALKLAVREALDYAKSTQPRIGWLRGDAGTKLETLEELNQLRKENEALKATTGDVASIIPLPAIPEPDEEISLTLLGNTIESNPLPPNGESWEILASQPVVIESTWLALFPFFFNRLSYTSGDYTNDGNYRIDRKHSLESIGFGIAFIFSDIIVRNAYFIAEDDYEYLLNYYIEMDLMNSDGTYPFTEHGARFARRQNVLKRSESSGISLKSGKIEVVKETITPADYELPF